MGPAASGGQTHRRIRALIERSFRGRVGRDELEDVELEAEDGGEVEYLEYLREERSRYAWVLRTHGGVPASTAQEAAERRYPYEPPDAPYRGLIFHDEAWHWAMLELEGEDYTVRRPELVAPSEAYRALDASSGVEVAGEHDAGPAGTVVVLDDADGEAQAPVERH